MLIFWILTGLLVMLAFAFIIPPFFTKTMVQTEAHDAINIAIYKEKCTEIEADDSLDAEQKQLAKQELKKTLGQELTGKTPIQGQARARWASLLVMILVPVCALGLYYRFGAPQLIEPPPPAPVMDEKMAEFPKMVEKLEKKMQETPDDPVGWQMLGRSYMILQRYQEAVPAFNQVIRLKGEKDAPALVDLAEAIAMSSNEQLAGQPSILLNNALAIDPNNMKALWLAGLAAAQAGDYPTAITHWEHLLAQFKPEDAEDRQAIEGHIAQARELMQTAQTGNTTKTTEASPATVVQLPITVTLDERLKNQLPANATLFIYARPAQGAKMPLAIVRKQASELPVNVVLDDNASVMPTMKLSGAKEVIVFARVSVSGNAMPQMGDLLGESTTISLPHTEQIQITIDQVVP
ncbi:c-type cytochrome biogenesis protein CcmI [Beggiatoa leptomitoformis]|uniref:C-type cytochrome biogenesis protein CcmI n=1 Tax=Beggiatoa leptomitoformis TaxID=288004 RepID=A0A2N9YI74_9GAMM|nr:c-type cytochrome biogenesis protein CcmI [Beggiatoa leptomitoformis]ALG67655.1 c-type cytochrome biogenesis protein CcmI [Beggiatoa leptomitoformis]AUI70109.1 c-type cytochrome biogenesis protein CcmI [Beggiatoa leptomitoformis]